MSKPTTQLRNIASLKALGNIIDALQFSRGKFYYKPEDGAISSKEHEIIQAEFCEFLKDKKEEFLKDTKDDSTKYQLSILKGKYDKLQRGIRAEPFKDDKALVEYYFPDDCRELYKKIDKIPLSVNRTFYDVIFKSIKTDAKHLVKSTINNFKLFSKYAKLFNCEKIYNKVLQGFQNPPPLQRRKTTRRSSMLSGQNTPNASEMDMRRNELMGSYRVRSRSSKKTIDASKVKHTTLGKKRKKKSIGKRKSKTKRKSTSI